MNAQRLGDDVAHPPARIERGIGVLEDHLHLAPQRPQLAQRLVRDVLALEAKLARR